MPYFIMAIIITIVYITINYEILFLRGDERKTSIFRIRTGLVAGNQIDKHLRKTTNDLTRVADAAAE